MHLNLAAITKKIKTPGVNGENPWNFIVWNLNESPYNGYLEGEMQWLHEFPAYSGGIVLEDTDANKYPTQIIPEKSVIPGFRTRILFKAEIPAMGYKMFKVIKEGIGRGEKIHKTSLETENFRVDFSEETGLKIYSKTLDKTFDTLLKPQCFEDLADSECFNETCYGKRLEDFEFISIETVEMGKFRTILKAKYRFRNSALTLYYSFYKDTDYFDVKYIVNWNEDHIALKLMSKTGIDKLIVSSPFATEDRFDTASDQPMGEWISMYGENAGVSFIGDSSFAYTKYSDEIGISVLRSCIYAEMTLEDEMPAEDYPIMEQGIGEGKLRIFIHKGDYLENGVPNMAKAFNNAPIVLSESNHDGIYPASASFGAVDSKSVYITALKKAENGDQNILRLNEFSGLGQDVTLKYFDKDFKISLDPYEIKTLKITDNGVLEVNITED